MKLHLPKGLRTALLAVFALAATTQTASAAAAAYENLLEHTGKQIKTWPVELIAENNYNFPGVQANSMDWVLNIGLYNIAPEQDGNDYMGATVLTNTGSSINMKMDTRDLKIENSQVIAITPQGSIRFVASGDRANTLEPGTYLSEVNAKLGTIGGSWQKKFAADGTTVNLNLSFAWDADGGQVIDGVQYGALTFLGGWYPDVNTGANLEPISGSIAGTVISDSYALPENFFTVTDPSAESVADSGGLYSLVDGGTVILDLYTSGSEAAWVITGDASLNDLLGGEYQDTTGTTPVERAMETTEKVQFIGNTGVIYLETPEDYTGSEPYKVTYSNPTTAEVDLRNGGSTKSVGFGADAGVELTVASSVLESTIFATDSQIPTALRICGDGVVVLDLGATARSVTIASTDNASNLKLQTTADVDVTVNLATATIGSQSTIVRDKAGDAGNGNLEVYLFDGQTPSSSQSLKSIENKVGGVTICGTAISADYSTIYYSALNVDDLKATGDISIEGDVSARNVIDAGGDIEVYGIVTSGEVKSTGTVTTGSTHDNSCSLSATEIEAAGGLVSYGSVTADTITTEGDVLVYNAPDSDNKLMSNKVYAASVTQNTQIGGNSSGITISADDTARAITPLLAGNVVVDASGIVADSIAAGATIELDSDATGSVTARESITDAVIKLDNDELATGATSNDAVSITTQKITAAGTLETTDVELTDGYSISAAALTATDSIQAGDTTITAADDESAVLENVILLTDSEATVEGITADTVEIGDDYTVNMATISAAGGVSAGDNATLNNVMIAEGAFTNSGRVNLNNTGFMGGATSFGGNDGAAITVDPYNEGVDNVKITGVLDGSGLNISSLVLNAEGLSFGANTTSYDILVGDELTYQPDASNYTLNIEPFVRAELSYDAATGTVTISGHKDEYGIKNELTTTANRQAAMSSLNSALPGAEAGSPLSLINEYIGHVNRYSLADRQQVLDAVSGASLVALADAQRRGLRDSQRNIRNRVIQMGGGTSKGLTTDWQYAGLQAWAQADASFASIGGNQDECGYDFNTTGATVGANVDLTANLVVGMAFSASYGDIDVESHDYGTVDTSSYYLNFFGRYQRNRWVHMFIFTVGMDEMDTERRVLGYTASGNTEGTTYSLYYELGYTIGLDYEYNHVLQPLVSVTLTTAQMSSFVERGSIGNAGLRYEGEDFVYGQLAIGARYQGVIYESVHERSAVLEARAVITHDIGDKTDHATLSYMGGHNFSVKGADATGLGFEIGAGLSIPVEQHTTLFADADFTYAPEYTGFRANVGVRYDF